MENQELQKIIKDFEELEKKLQDPATTGDPQNFKKISTEYSDISPKAKLAKDIVALAAQKQDVLKMLDQESENDMKELLNNELSDLETKLTNYEKELKEMMRSSDPDDKRDVILEIRAGTGGEEAALFTSDLYRMYLKFAENNGWQVQQLSANYTGTSGLKEVIANIQGTNVYGKLKHESGVHRVQRVPSTESSGRVHTSASSVVILPEVDDLPDIKINDSDIKVDVYRSTGPGGQSVNTTDSAVRLTHIPTGLVVTCQDEKSQHKNKARAMSILKSKLYQIQQEEMLEEQASTRQSAIRGGDRSVKIRTYNFPDNRVTDHRIKKTWHNLSQVLDGDIEEIIKETSEKLRDDSDT